MIDVICQDQNPWFDLASSYVGPILVFIVTVLAAIVSYRTYRNQTDPEIVVYATPDLDSPMIIMLVIENIGRGVARNIKFSLSREIPHRAFEISKGENKSWMTSGPLINGIPALGPGARREIRWGQYGALHNLLGDNIISVDATFERKSVFCPNEKIILRSNSLLEISSFALSKVPSKSMEERQAIALEKIENQIRLLAKRKCNGSSPKQVM